MRGSALCPAPASSAWLRRPDAQATTAGLSACGPGIKGPCPVQDRTPEGPPSPHSAVSIQEGCGQLIPRAWEPRQVSVGPGQAQVSLPPVPPPCGLPVPAQGCDGTLGAVGCWDLRVSGAFLPSSSPASGGAVARSPPGPGPPGRGASPAAAPGTGLFQNSVHPKSDQGPEGLCSGGFQLW